RDGLPHDHRARGAEVAHDGRVGVGDPVAEQGAAAFGGDARGVEDVLDADRHAGERAEVARHAKPGLHEERRLGLEPGERVDAWLGLAVPRDAFRYRRQDALLAHPGGSQAVDLYMTPLAGAIPRRRETTHKGGAQMKERLVLVILLALAFMALAPAGAAVADSESHSYQLHMEHPNVSEASNGDRV